ncbi:hypothetical protein [Brucella intermedia]|uniref:hypothetical protein n=1 Tax=Brucella intermedia TaxID=94625 RepID=UPI002248D06E|nr:hypothetical protein [Brucella intermedia]
MTDERDYILSAAAALGGEVKNNWKEKKARTVGDTYDKAAIDVLKGLNSRRKPWDDLMYDPNDAKEVAAIRARIETYMAANPGEKLPPEIAAFMERE